MDTISENNVAYDTLYVEDIPHVLLVEQDNSGAEIMEILKNSKLKIDRLDPNTVP